MSVEYTMIVRRTSRRPATGLWNRLRLRRWITHVEVLGVYPITEMRRSRRVNAADDTEVTIKLRPRDPLAMFLNSSLD